MDYPARLRSLGCEPPSEPPGRDIEAIESAIGVALPGAYRKFLGACGGWWREILCPCREPTPFGEDHNISAFHDAKQVAGLLDSMITPRNMITIGVGNFASYTCLSIAGVDRGSVYALDGEFRCYWDDEEFELRFNGMADSIRRYLELRGEDSLPEKPMGYQSMYLLAESFDEFLSLCKPCPDGP